MSFDYQEPAPTEELEVPPDEETPEEDLVETSEEEPIGESSKELMDEDEVKNVLLQIVKDVEEEESINREQMLQVLRKLDYFWHGIQRLYWSSTSNEYKPIGEGDEDLALEAEGLSEVVNIYRAHGESVIAALSTGVPNIKFMPHDADSPVDIISASSYTKIAELIHRRNQAPLLLVKALFTLWNQHYVAAYHYSKEDKKFGTYTKVTHRVESQEVEQLVCAECGEPAQDELSPCSVCGSQEKVVERFLKDVRVPVEEKLAKSSQEIEIHGPLNVLIQSHATCPQDTGILNLYTEHDIAKVYAQYQSAVTKIRENVSEDLDASSRALHGTTPLQNKVTVRQSWIRPWMFWRLGISSLDKIKFLLEKYPNGAYLVSVDDDVLEIHEENLDDRWTISKSPVSRTVISDPLGQTIVSLQETVNDLYSFSKETIRQGVPETFFDSRILDGDKYQSMRAVPGMLVPVNKQPGQSIQESFFQFKSATLSKEVDVFRARTDSDAQFLSGAFPSIYGGPNEGSSGTLGEYSLSKNMALQRLQISWKILVSWWVEMMGKVTVDFARNMETDERFVKPSGNVYTNVIIKKAELDAGKVGEVDTESSEQIPMSWAQKRDLVLQILRLNNDMLNAVLFHPENANLVANLLGASEFYVPGDEDRTKQLLEILQLIKTISPDGMNPSVPTEPEVDNTPVHIEICRAWANSLEGQHIKKTNPEGYANVLMHLRMHLSQVAPPPMPTEEKGKAPQKNSPGDLPEITPEPNTPAQM